MNRAVYCIRVGQDGLLEKATMHLCHQGVKFFVKDDDVRLDEDAAYKIMASMSDDELEAFNNEFKGRRYYITPNPTGAPNPFGDDGPYPLKRLLEGMGIHDIPAGMNDYYIVKM